MVPGTVLGSTDPNINKIWLLPLRNLGSSFIRQTCKLNFSTMGFLMFQTLELYKLEFFCTSAK